MKAMVLNKVSQLAENPDPLKFTEVKKPVPLNNEILIRVKACGVCHTELDEIEGRLIPAKYPVIPGHQVIGRVERMGKSAGLFREGDWAAAGWIFSACGKCSFCLSGLENLCPEFKGTGLDANGGYAEYMTIGENFACRIPDPLISVPDDALKIAPLICAGAIGYRSIRLAGIRNGDTLGLTGFGSSGSLVLRMVKHLYPGTKIFVFTRNEGERRSALELGAVWSGPIGGDCPEKLSAVIDTTPVWTAVLRSLEVLKPAGRLVINVIRKEDSDKNILSSIEYSTHLWMEKEIKSVANVSRKDVEECLELAADAHLKPLVRIYPLSEANSALKELKEGKITGSKVIGLDIIQTGGRQQFSNSI
jgi:propanol-preferring alcohol dehydrogenase